MRSAISDVLGPTTRTARICLRNALPTLIASQCIPRSDLHRVVIGRNS